MSRIENMHLTTGHVLAICFGTSNDKRRITTSQEDQPRSLMVTKPFLPNRVSLQIMAPCYFAVDRRAGSISNYFKYDFNYHGRANGQTLHSIDQPNVAGLWPKDLNK
jgi:hypothetical protein